jgi:hypothetical protein
LTLIEEDPFNSRTDFPEAEIAALANAAPAALLKAAVPVAADRGLADSRRGYTTAV